MNWDDLRYLVAIIDNKTASAAAKKMGVNYVTVCRKIERLERSLKKKLIFFKDNSYYPTNEGQALYEKAVEISLSLMDMEEESTAGSHLKQTLTLSSSASIAENILIPGLKPILNKYPQVKINFLISTNIESLHKRECDIAIRYINTDRDYEGDLLRNINYHLCCSKQYLENEILCDKKIKTLLYNFDLKDLPENHYIIDKYGRKSILFESNTLNSIYVAIKNDFGVSLLPDYLIDDSLHIIQKNVLQKKIIICFPKRIQDITAGRIIIDEIKKIFSDNQQFT
ncbi:LysR family transcriptional regulator [Gilliamella sp. B3172]|uniref:LysR family transcriptional regulator n=1 Tax=Gilliamella sp. B3172 TaxID=2818006 RepID=UPI0022699ED5|nr:LysR family transcriptional regulator [Gilliamella sp. B3172]MCX8640210.1 LysR family transcriptional regulator [Gilliamella sp. B3172]